MAPAVRVEGLGKSYRLGVTHAGSIRELANRTTSRIFRRDVPALPAAPPPVGADRIAGDGLFWALRDVAFEIQPGEVVGIVGKNGAGKSTLLKILSRITFPTTGRVELSGQVASLLEVGTAFHPELTGRENVYLNGTILGMTRREIAGKFDEIVDFSGVENFIDTPVKRYSSGMLVRLGFAVAAHLDSDTLMIDEVLAVGDAEFQNKCIGKMNHVANSGRTVLFVSHQISAIRSVCSRVILLRNGSVAYDGDTESGLHVYLNHHHDGSHHRARFDSNRPIRAVSAELLVNGESIGRAHIGDELSIVVEFTAETPTRYPAVGYIVYDDRGTPILNANNGYQKMSPLTESVTAGRVECHLGQVPLMPGWYTVSLWIGNNYGAGHVAEHALRFEVEDRDIWGTARTPPRSCSLLWWPTRFEAHTAASQSDA